jgi:hypothetical protein
MGSMPFHLPRVMRSHRREGARGLPRTSRAAEWIAVLYIGLVLATPLLILEGPRVLPALELVTMSQPAKAQPVSDTQR